MSSQEHEGTSFEQITLFNHYITECTPFACPHGERFDDTQCTCVPGRFFNLILSILMRNFA